MRVKLLMLIILALTLVGCDLMIETLPEPEATPIASLPTAASSEWYTVYFTDPNDEFQESGPDVALAEAIGQARMSLDVAIYDLDLDTIKDALLDAHQRGVTVRMVVESDNMDEEAVQALKDAGIAILGDRREGYMHNKFIVIDRLEVWGGSMNYTSNDAYRNNNNLIRVRSSKLAENYTTEFDEMFNEDLFGSADRPATPYTSLTINDTLVEVYFSPDDGVADHIISLVQSAQQSIYFLAYSFTSDDIGDAILERGEAGVTVAGVFETLQYKSNGKSSEFDRLRTAGLDVWLDANPRNMHEKVIIIDGQIVIAGSYNFSANAENNNDENIMVLHNPEIAAQFTAEFNQLLALAKGK